MEVVGAPLDLRLEGNLQYFGQWTWTGQGTEPLVKGKHQDHKILRFPMCTSLSCKGLQKQPQYPQGLLLILERKGRIFSKKEK